MTCKVIIVAGNADGTTAIDLMVSKKVKCLPVIRGDALVGLVSSRDLIKVFVRSDEEIKTEIVRRLALRTAAKVEVAVDQGGVTITGQIDTLSGALLAVRHTESVDGVLAVHDKLTWTSNHIAADLPFWGGV